MPKIKVLSGGGFPEREVTSPTIGALRTELNISPGTEISVGGTNVGDEYELKEGDVVAAVSSNKTGGLYAIMFEVIA